MKKTGPISTRDKEVGNWAPHWPPASRYREKWRRFSFIFFSLKKINRSISVSILDPRNACGCTSMWVGVGGGIGGVRWSTKPRPSTVRGEPIGASDLATVAILEVGSRAFEAAFLLFFFVFLNGCFCWKESMTTPRMRTFDCFFWPFHFVFHSFLEHDFLFFASIHFAKKKMISWNDFLRRRGRRTIFFCFFFVFSRRYGHGRTRCRRPLLSLERSGKRHEMKLKKKNKTKKQKDQTQTPKTKEKRRETENYRWVGCADCVRGTSTCPRRCPRERSRRRPPSLPKAVSEFCSIDQKVKK